MVGTLVMAPKSVTFRRHDHLVSVLFGDLLSHSYNITFSMFLYLVLLTVTSLNSNVQIQQEFSRNELIRFEVQLEQLTSLACDD